MALLNITRKNIIKRKLRVDEIVKAQKQTNFQEHEENILIIKVVLFVT